MRVALSAVLLSIWLCSCTALNASDSERSHNTPLKRTDAFTNHVSSTLTEVMRDVVPIVRAMKDELSNELRTESTKVREELSSQMKRPLPSRKELSVP
jgi:hypothetical protein